MDSTTRGKSIFDIPKPLPLGEDVEAQPKKRRRKKKIVKKPKVAKAGGVEVSQVKGQSKSQITLKQPGLTQEITIYTGDKTNPRVGKGRTNKNKPNWNMKPAKFKNSRGLRDDRVYLQPPKREYFGNRYKSALDKIKIDQKVREAGLLKNKEIEEKKERADREVREVRDRQQRERIQLAQREAAKDSTIEELKRERAGIVASHNVSQRNQSRATILGGDVGELNKLIRRRGYDAIELLVRKGEISDQSTILQLDLDAAELNRLVAIRTEEGNDFPIGGRVTYLSGTGQPFEGIVKNETDKFVTIQKDDGSKVRVPKTNIQSGQRVAEARSQSRDPSVRRGRRPPKAEDFGSPRPDGSSAEERPAFRRDRVRSEQKQQKRREATPFEEKLRRQAQTQPVELSAEEQEEIRFRIYESLTTASLEKALAEAEASSPPAGDKTIDELRLELQSDESEEALLEESYRQSRERELKRPEPRPPAPEPELQSEEEPVTAETLSSEEEQRAIQKAQQTPRQFFEGLSKQTPRGELFQAELTSRQPTASEQRTGVGFTFFRGKRDFQPVITAESIIEGLSSESSSSEGETAKEFLDRQRREEEEEKRKPTETIKVRNNISGNTKTITILELQTAIEKLSGLEGSQLLRQLDRERSKKSGSLNFGFRNSKLERALGL
jgi:hypothetical protein